MLQVLVIPFNTCAKNLRKVTVVWFSRIVETIRNKKPAEDQQI
ncbi:hypothetical protein [Gaetbulibacter sp. S0825]|nr:hypothetical protein [Gaetbulibacter sp. S0825]